MIAFPQISSQTETSFRPAPPASTSQRVAKLEAKPAPKGHGELILVVDDESGVRELTTTVLKRNGYRALVAGDGSEALALFAPRSHEISLVITDIKMPHLDGAGLVQVIHQLNPAVKVLAMSGVTQIDKPKGQAAAAAFLMKPFTIDALLGAVHRLLQISAGPVRE